MSNAVYQQKGSSYFTSNEETTIVHKSLPPKTFTVEFHPQIGYYLETSEDMKIPEVIYGKENNKSDKILNTFYDRPNNTGVILLGEKGSGKTLLTKIISKDAREKGIPTILINSQHSGEDFCKFLQSIKQPCIVIFDEFDKTYPTSQSQSVLLTLLDGVFNSKKLFIVCMNGDHNFNFYFKNRPGRFYYTFKYTTLDKDSIQEYLDKNIKHKDSANSLMNYLGLFTSLSFDMLKAMVEEVNRYWTKDSNISDLLQDLNSSPLEQYSKFKIKKLTVDDPELSQKIEKFDDEINNGNALNPFKDSIFVTYNLKNEKPVKSNSNSPFVDDTDDKFDMLYFYPTDIVSVTKEGIKLKNKIGELIVIKDEKKESGYLDMIRLAI